MITIVSNPVSATPGSTVCIVVTGCTTVPNINASFLGQSLVSRVSGADGTYMICVTLPRSKKGVLSIDIEAGDEIEVANVRVV